MSPLTGGSSGLAASSSPFDHNTVGAAGSKPIANPLLPSSLAANNAPVKKGGLASGQPPIAADLLPAKQSSSGGSNSSGGSGKGNSNNAGSGQGKDTKPADQVASQESDSFYKMYNKEIKVNQDEIPIILAELTDAAFNFIQRENYEKALILLQKTEGVLEVSSN